MNRVSVGTSGWVGLSPKDFSRRYDAVEFNWTFHERDSGTEQFQKVAEELRELRVQAILKVSGLATHERRLRNPEEWWPSLWAKYSVLKNAGVLGALLWQLAPSHQCNQHSLGDLRNLARRLPRDVLHVFEFRHSSWYRSSAMLEILRGHRFCLAWIHITNEDGWCGDLPSGWASKERTCKAAYFRLFGTKQKAVGRYSEDFLRNEVFSHCSPSGHCQVDDAFVVFAQADVPDHAKADATAFVELLGRQSVDVVRTTRWERDVLAASLGLGIGSIVEGVVQRMTHRTVFVDIGRACRAFLCANHARRVGLLENLRLGTTLQGLVVENIDFQGEWGLIGLTCHNAVVSLGGVDEDVEEQERRAELAAELQSVSDDTASEYSETTSVSSARPRLRRWHSAEVRSTASSVSCAIPGSALNVGGGSSASSTSGHTRWSSRAGTATTVTASPAVVARRQAAEQEAAEAVARSRAAREARDARAREWARRTVRKALGLDASKSKASSQVGASGLQRGRAEMTSSLQSNSSKLRSRSEGPAVHTRREQAEAALFEARVAQRAEDRLLAAAEARKAVRDFGDSQQRISAGEWLDGLDASDGEDQDPEVPLSPASSPSAATAAEDATSASNTAVDEGLREEESGSCRSESQPSSSRTSPREAQGQSVVKEKKEEACTSSSVPPAPLAAKGLAAAEAGPDAASTKRKKSRPTRSASQERRRAQLSACSQAQGGAVSAESEEKPVPKRTEAVSWLLDDGRDDDDMVADPSATAAAAAADQRVSPPTDGSNTVAPLDQSAKADAPVGKSAPEQQAVQEGITSHIPDSTEENSQPSGVCGAKRATSTSSSCTSTVEQKKVVNGKALATAPPRQMQQAAATARRQPAVAQCLSTTPLPTVPEHGHRIGLSSSHRQMWADVQDEDELDGIADASLRAAAEGMLTNLYKRAEEDATRKSSQFQRSSGSEALVVEDEVLLHGPLLSTQPSVAAAAEEEEEAEESAFLAVCDRCGNTHIVQVDFMGLGLNFTCEQVGACCEWGGSSSSSKARSTASTAEPTNVAASGPVLPDRATLSALSAEEKRMLFERHVLQKREERLKPKDIQAAVVQLLQASAPKERYRNDEVVTRKGERFIQVQTSLDPGPGCQIGGILGWRTKQGRRGLGLKKMSKEEADRICISNKERAHTRKATDAGGYKKGYVFENKWSRHTAESSKGSAPKAQGK